MHTTLPAVATAPEVRTGIAGWIARHPIAAFMAWLFTVGQAIAFTPLLADVPVPNQVFIVATSVLGLFLPAVVITWIADGREAAVRFLRRFVDWRVAPRWYVMALLVVPVVALALAWLILGAPPATSPGVWVEALVFGFVLSFVLTLVPNNWVEEGAWSGFVQARLQNRYAPAMAAIIVAPFFALQHVSLVAGNPLPLVAMVMIGLAVVMIPFRMLTGWMWNRTGSLLLLGFLHAAGNAVASGSGFDGGLLRKLYPDDVMTAGMLHMLAYAIVGIAVLLATRARLGLRRTGDGAR